MMSCPNCGEEQVLYNRTVTDRRGSDRVGIQRGACQHCGANVRRDTSTGEAVPFGPGLATDEANAVIELRRRAGTRPTNYTHYCPECEEEWEQNVDHEHELFVWPWEGGHDDMRVGGWCQHARTETVDLAPDGTPTENVATLDSEVVTTSAEKHRASKEQDTSDLRAVAESEASSRHRSLTIECQAVFTDPREAASHQHRTGHEVHIELLDEPL